MGTSGDTGAFSVLVMMVLVFAAILGVWAYNDLYGHIEDTRALIDNINNEIRKLRFSQDG